MVYYIYIIYAIYNMVYFSELKVGSVCLACAMKERPWLESLA